MIETPEAVGLIPAVTNSIAWIQEAMTIFMDPPAVYFVGFAVVGAAAGVARKFVPMKRK